MGPEEEGDAAAIKPESRDHGLLQWLIDKFAGVIVAEVPAPEAESLGAESIDLNEEETMGVFKVLNPRMATDLLDWERRELVAIADKATPYGISAKAVVDAELLLNYGLQSGAEIPMSLAQDIDSFRELLSLDARTFKTKKEAGEIDPAGLAAKFQAASNALARIMEDVNAQSLRNTSKQYGRKIWKWENRSEAEIMSLKLWWITGLTLGFILFAEVGQQTLLDWYPLDHGIEDGLIFNLHLLYYVISFLVPFAYGLLGACTYLLKSNHFYAVERTFDLHRVPEYYNRLILGLIAGGTIQLFVEQIETDGGDVLHLSAAMLGFLAGYNIDFLFQAMERMVQAILPKVGLSSAARAKPRPGPATSVNLDVNDLIAKMDATADSDEKAYYRELIDRAMGKS